MLLVYHRCSINVYRCVVVVVVNLESGPQSLGFALERAVSSGLLIVSLSFRNLTWCFAGLLQPSLKFRICHSSSSALPGISQILSPSVVTDRTKRGRIRTKRSEDFVLSIFPMGKP